MSRMRAVLGSLKTMMAETTKKYHFAVIEFEEKCEGDEPSFDVVPKSWLFEEESTIQCFYPKKGTIHKIRKWASEKKSPEKNWGIYRVARIVCEAKNWEQDLRRLNRTLEPPKNSTDIDNRESQAIHELVRIISEEDMGRTLQEKQPLPFIGDETLLNNLILEDATNITIVPEPNNNTKILKDFNAALEEMEDRIVKVIKSQKRSLQYDIDKKIDELKFMLSACVPIWRRSTMAMAKMMCELNSESPCPSKPSKNFKPSTTFWHVRQKNESLCSESSFTSNFGEGSATLIQRMQ
ncbi:uncharacterized protein [Neodiprion pinetum]|uniref:uncharacterized protein n=1 Tax=Neodiprion pinetum TaxID=441929 RepID=UPI00371EE4C2